MSPDRQAAVDAVRAQGVEVIHFNQWADTPSGYDLLILGQTVPVDLLDPRQKVLGLRTLNRKTRLDALARAGLPVQPYGAPTDMAALDLLRQSWGGGPVIAKLDWSFRRAGIALLPDGAPLPLDFDPTSDVIMQPLLGDPRTLKIDVCADQVLGATWLDTRAITAPNWQIVGPRGQWTTDVSDHIAQIASDAGRALMAYGCGYISLDIMISDDSPRIIEANTTSVGKAQWRDEPHPYAERLARGLMACVAQIDALPDVAALTDLAMTGGNANEAVAPGQSIGTFTTPPDLPAILDNMMLAADETPAEDQAEIANEMVAALIAHARDKVPFYRQVSGDLPPVDQTLIQAKTLDFTARGHPPEHGIVRHAPSLDGITPAALTTRFAAEVSAAVRRRALRWNAVTGVKEHPLIDTASAGQGGIGYDSPAEAIWQALGDDPVTLWTRPETALRLADSLADGADQSAIPLRAIVLSGPPLDPAARDRITQALNIPVVETLYHPGAGCFAIRCPKHGGYHLLPDAVTVDALSPLTITSPYNYAQPVIRQQTELTAERIGAYTCDCPVKPALTINLRD